MSAYTYQLFFNFSLQLLLLEGVFVAALAPRSVRPLRMVLALALFFGLAVPYVSLMSPYYYRHWWVSIAHYLGLFAVSLLILRLCTTLKSKEILFIGTAGYAVQHLTYSASVIVLRILRYGLCLGWAEAGNVSWPVFHLLPYLLAAAVVWRCLIVPYRHRGALRDADVRMLSLCLLMLCGCVGLSTAAQGMNGSWDWKTECLFCAYSVLCCIMALTLQFNLFRSNKTEENNELLEQLVRMARQQQAIARGNVDFINCRCHELRCRLAELRRSQPTEQQSGILQQAEQAVTIYDRYIQTGNDAVDLVLTEKSLLCERYHIQFSVIVDGRVLSFLSAADTYALFNNLMDNAIESVREAPLDRRTVSLRVEAHGNMVLLHQDNYCARLPRFSDGLPVAAGHDSPGLGVRSVKYIVEKWNGMLRMQAVGERFAVDILLPAAGEQAAGTTDK